eukprot:scaffold32199_cov25-Tisochrysis_lutea.AAC.1
MVHHCSCVRLLHSPWPFSALHTVGWVIHIRLYSAAALSSWTSYKQTANCSNATSWSINEHGYYTRLGCTRPDLAMQTIGLATRTIDRAICTQLYSAAFVTHHELPYTAARDCHSLEQCMIVCRVAPPRTQCLMGLRGLRKGRLVYLCVGPAGGFFSEHGLATSCGLGEGVHAFVGVGVGRCGYCYLACLSAVLSQSQHTLWVFPQQNKQRLARQMQAKCKFNDDYSLLLGVHYRNRQAEGKAVSNFS